MQVRGPTYLCDHVKVAAGDAAYTLLAVDLVSTPTAVHHLARFLPSVRCVMCGVVVCVGGFYVCCMCAFLPSPKTREWGESVDDGGDVFFLNGKLGGSGVCFYSGMGAVGVTFCVARGGDDNTTWVLLSSLCHGYTPESASTAALHSPPHGFVLTLPACLPAFVCVCVYVCVRVCAADAAVRHHALCST